MSRAAANPWRMRAVSAEVMTVMMMEVANKLKFKWLSVPDSFETHRLDAASRNIMVWPRSKKGWEIEKFSIVVPG